MAETEAEVDARLCRVIALAETTVFETPFAWRAMAPGGPAADAIACVRDNAVWREFAPVVEDGPPGGFRVVRFRFAEDGPSAIGFVGWLHTRLRLDGQTGAIVICGEDDRRSPALHEICQGAMDYWACPLGPASDRFIQVTLDQIERGRRLTV